MSEWQNMAYRNLGDHAGLPYTWRTRSEVIVSSDNHEHEGKEVQEVPIP
jgi:hypothetical protein